MKSACGIVFVTAIYQRTMLKYGDRGDRFILQEVGAMNQNMSLLCENLGLGSCIIGGYDDDKVNDFLGIDGATESIQSVMIIGKR